jgi:hypothetical protein
MPLCRSVIHLCAAAVGAARRAAERHAARQRRRRSEGGSARRDRDDCREHDRPPVAGSDRTRRPLPVPEPLARPLHAHHRAARLRHGRTDRDRAARRCERHRAAGDYAPRRTRGVGHRQQPGAARRPLVGPGQRQHRSASDGGAAAAGAQLDGAVADGEGHHGEQHRQYPWSVRRSVPTESRRAAGLPADFRLGLRAAEDEPRGDRRVSDRHEHVRHHSRAIDWRTGAGRLPLGHERHARLDVRVLSE